MKNRKNELNRRIVIMLHIMAYIFYVLNLVLFFQTFFNWGNIIVLNFGTSQLFGDCSKWVARFGFVVLFGLVMLRKNNFTEPVPIAKNWINVWKIMLCVTCVVFVYSWILTGNIDENSFKNANSGEAILIAGRVMRKFIAELGLGICFMISALTIVLSDAKE